MFCTITFVRVKIRSKCRLGLAQGNELKARASTLLACGLETRIIQYKIYILKIIVSFFFFEGFQLVKLGGHISGSLFNYFFIKWISSPWKVIVISRYDLPCQINDNYLPSQVYNYSSIFMSTVDRSLHFSSIIFRRI